MQSDFNKGHKFEFGVIVEGQTEEEMSFITVSLILLNKGTSLYNTNYEPNSKEVKLTSKQIQRFKSFQTKKGGCLLYNRPSMKFQWNSNGKHYERLATRLSYILTHGPIPDGLTVYQKCGESKCVNPGCLELGTPFKSAQSKRKQ